MVEPVMYAVHNLKKNLSKITQYFHLCNIYFLFKVKDYFIGIYN